jgi:chitodextrinase
MESRPYDAAQHRVGGDGRGNRMLRIQTRRRRTGLARVGSVVLLLAALLLPAPPARADAVVVSEQPLDGWDTNGIVYAVKIVGDIAYIGGDFSVVRSPVSGSQVRNNVAALDITTGEITGFRADTNSIVRAIDGTASALWIGGLFTSIGGQARNRIASVDTTTGAVRAGVTTSADGTVYEIERSGGFVYVGGAFRTIDGVPRNRIARIAASDGSLDTGWDPNANATVRGIAVPNDGSTVYVGGSFTSIAGATSAFVAGLSPTTGQVTSPAWGNLDYPVLDLDVTPSGDRLIGAVGGLGNRVTVWNTSTGNQSWRIIVDGDVQAVAHHAGNAYFGFHDGFQGVQTAKLMSADVYSGALESWRPSIAEFWGVWDIDATGGGLVAGGQFLAVEGIPTRGVAIFPPLDDTDSSAPSTPTNLVQVDSTATTITLTWDPSIDDVGVTTYTVIRDGLPIGTTVEPTYTDTDLFPGATYLYEVTAGDAAANESPPAGPLAATTSEAFIAVGSDWSYLDDGTDQGTVWREVGFDAATWPVGQAELGFGDGGEATVLTPGAVTYYFVRDFTVVGALLENATLLFKRDDGIVVYINGVEALRDNMPSGTIGATTTASQTIAGSDESVFNETTVPANLFHVGVNRIAVEIHQRSPGSSDISFDLAMYAETAPDTTPPTVPQNPRATTVLSDSVTLEWDASTDDTEVANYVVNRDGVPIASTTSLSFTDTTVAEATSYAYSIEAFDAAGNGSGPSELVSVDTPASDFTPPTAPHGVVVLDASETSIDLAWDPSTDDTAVSGYTVRRDGAVVGTPVATAFQDTGLMAGTAYTYTIDAFDAAGNVSPPSEPIDALTLPPDITPPSVPTDVSVTGVTATTVELTWTSSTDDRGVTGYVVRRDGLVVGTPPDTAFTDTGLIPGSEYDYTVEASDAAGNTSGQTPPTTATTANDSTPPTVPSALTVTGTTLDSVSLSWGPSTDDLAFDTYVVYRNGIPIATTTDTTFTDTGLAWSTTYSYEVAARDVAGNESAPAGPVEATTDDNVVTTTLVSEGAVWRYLDDGSDQGTQWQSLAFDDSGWESGPAQLGFGDGDETTVLTEGFITYYFRTTLDVAGDVVGDATLRVIRDDGIAVHVNGTEVFTDNLPSAYDHLTGATRTVAGNNERTFLTATIPGSVFVAGTNVVAVEMHQRNLSSSDISFDLELTADIAVAIPDSTPPSVPEEVTIGSETLESLTVSWSPSSDDVGVALYVVRRGGVVVGSTSSTSFVDGGLASDTTYSYTVSAQDAAGNESAESSVAQGTTLAPDTTSPTEPTDLAVLTVTRSSAELGWTASTDDVGVAGYTVAVDGATHGTATGTSYTVDGLSPDTTYAVSVTAFDAAGNTSGAAITSVTTEPPDTTAPTDPTALTVAGATPTTIDLTWGASTDDEELAGYIVRRNGVIVGNPTSTGFSDVGLDPATTYEYTVQAVDASGNRSAEVWTDATTSDDTTAPSTPTGLAVVDEQVDAIVLSWTDSIDDVAVAEYVVYRDGAEAGRTPVVNFRDSGLAADTTYTYAVSAVDTSGNESARSAFVEGTTMVTIETQTLVAEGSTWRYLDDGSDQGADWKEPGFDDSSWASGPAELGFGDGDEATVLQGGFITYYFRRSIEVDGDVASDVDLRYKRDDAIAIYVNGSLVETSNLPESWDYLTGATTTVPNSDENAWVTSTIWGGFFTPGTNVIAVEIHNRSTSSSDITFDLSMTADVRLPS